MPYFRTFVLVAAAVIIAAIPTVSQASGTHENMAILKDQGSRIYIEGDQVVTRVRLATGNFSGGHSELNGNEAAYLLRITETSADGITLPPYEMPLFADLMQVKIHNYTRQLPQGYWVVHAELKDGRSLDGQLLGSDEDRFFVKGAEFRSFERQAIADERDAMLTEQGIYWNMLGVAAGAVVGAGTVGFITNRLNHNIEDRRERSQVRREQDYVMKIRELIRHELVAYQSFYDSLLSSGIDPKHQGAPKTTRHVKSDAPHYKSLVDFITYRPQKYERLSPETKANVLEADSFQEIDDAYANMERYRASIYVIPRDRDREEYIEFDLEQAQITLKMLNEAIASIRFPQVGVTNLPAG